MTQDTRTRMIHGAALLIGARGAKSTSLRDLAREAGVPLGSTYHYFPEGKQQLIDEFDRRYLTSLLEAHDNNISAAARAAGIERMSIYKMMRRLGLEDETGRKRAPTGEDEAVPAETPTDHDE